MSLYPSFPFLLAITRTNFCLLTSFSGIKYTMRIGCNTKLPYKTSNLCTVLVPKLPAPVRNQPHRILSSHQFFDNTSQFTNHHKILQGPFQVYLKIQVILLWVRTHNQYNKKVFSVWMLNKTLFSKVWQFGEGGWRDDTSSLKGFKARGSNFCHPLALQTIRVAFSIYRVTHKKTVRLQ